jgi:hypothetical protein
MKSIIVMISVALLALAGCLARPAEGLPGAVSDKFAELGSKYSDGLGAILNNCTRSGETAYVVVGSGGFSGVTYIYDSSGKLLQQYDWDDMVGPGETPPPFDSSVYECTVMKESKPIAPTPLP